MCKCDICGQDAVCVSVCMCISRSKEGIAILTCLERVNLAMAFTQVKPVNSGVKWGVLMDLNKGILF